MQSQGLFIDLDERGPEVMEEVDEQTLDVRAIVILIGHDHDLAVAERLHLLVLLAVLKTLCARKDKWD